MNFVMTGKIGLKLVLDWVIIQQTKYGTLGDRFAPFKSLLHSMVVRQWGLRYNLNSHAFKIYCS
jgi:hypothetical protein